MINKMRPLKNTKESCMKGDVLCLLLKENLGVYELYRVFNIFRKGEYCYGYQKDHQIKRTD